MNVARLQALQQAEGPRCCINTLHWPMTRHCPNALMDSALISRASIPLPSRESTPPAL
jgi:hypothetical protein